MTKLLTKRIKTVKFQAKYYDVFTHNPCFTTNKPLFTFSYDL